MECHCGFPGGEKMKRIILRADDLGYSEAVNYGMAYACENQMPISIGLMMNMPCVRHGYDLIREKGYCLGIHTNISVGRPVLAPAEIPSLVEEDGFFHSSKTIRSAGKDIIAVEDAEKETEAQIRKFIEMTGRQPDYLDMHAVFSKNFLQGVRNVGERLGIVCSTVPLETPTMRVGNAEVILNVHGSSGRTLDEDIEEFMASEYETMIYVFHPGYVDKAIMETSSVNVQRVYDADLLHSEKLRDCLAEKEIELITYSDLIGG